MSHGGGARAECLGHTFINTSLLEAALRHATHASRGVPSNERLAWLGDAVIEQAVSLLLYARHPGMTKGDLTQLRARFVSDVHLARLAKGAGLGARLSAAPRMASELHVLAGALEAVVGAIQLDGGDAMAAVKLVFAGWEPEAATEPPPRGGRSSSLPAPRRRAQ